MQTLGEWLAVLRSGRLEMGQRDELDPVTGCRVLDLFHGGVFCVIGDGECEDARVLGANADAVHLKASPRCHCTRNPISAAKRP